MHNADHAPSRLLNRKRRGGSQHFQENAFQDPAAFRLAHPSKVKFRPDNTRRENERIRKLGLPVSQPTQDLEAHHAARQPIVRRTCMIEIATENDGEIERALMFVFENLHCTRGLRRADHDLIIAGDELVEDSFWHAESPISTPASELLPVVERNRVVIAVIIVEVASEFVETYCSVKALRQPYYSEWMGGAVIHCAAVFDDYSLLDIPRRRNHPSVVLAGTRHGDHAKRKHLAQIIHRLIVTERTNSPIERREVPQDLHHGFHAMG